MGNLVGLVLVSHSSALAEGLRELLGQIGGDDVVVAVAAGGPGGGLGTSPERVTAALREAERGSGVVVLPDLGSAVLTVRALLDEGPRAVGVGADVRLVDAPFVEGAVAAAVTAASGADLEAVAAAAERARDVRKS